MYTFLLLTSMICYQPTQVLPKPVSCQCCPDCKCGTNCPCNGVSKKEHSLLNKLKQKREDRKKNRHKDEKSSVVYTEV